jgi:DNA-binding transcriptional regulator YiaG
MSKEIARKLKAARSKLDLTQKEFAEQVGVSVHTLVQWETGQTDPRGLALDALKEKLSAILGPKRGMKPE